MESPLVIADAAVSVHWGFVAGLGTLSVLHYVLAAVTLRGVAPCRVPLVEATMAQFTAAAANRVTVGGLGAAAVNTRYLITRGSPAVRAVTSVAAMQVAGGVSDLMLFVAVLCLTAGAGGAVVLLSSRASELLAAVPLLPVLGLGAALAVAAFVCGRRAARSPVVGHARAGLADLLDRPASLCLTLAASASTTFVLSLAFGLSVFAVPGTGLTPDDLPALIVAYMVGNAAGAALPSPGGVGGTEAALVAALTALGVAAAPALQAVLLFRAITYWAPVPIGLLACRTLRGGKALRESREPVA